ncbi:Non-catalytic module family DOC2 [Piromyces sp. E2]|nr:Non-catalytic module family DOC2 [Piromyces sp. E2]|eukprot:OUM68759.1 Non-catalytic module family DOC2 [Piromyces sp. E2]
MAFLLSKIFKTIAVVFTLTMVSCKKTINMKALVLTTEQGDTTDIVTNFKSYGIPYDVIEFKPSEPFTGKLDLYDENNDPKYNFIVVNGGDLIYEVNGSWISALTRSQWADLEDYEAKNGVRRVIISDDVSFKTDVTVEDVNNWGETLPEQPLMADTSDEVKKIFNDAGVKITAPLDVNYIYHTRVKILDPSTTKPLLYYVDDGKQGAVAATIAKYKDGREVMSFFFGFGTWQQSCLIMNHIWLTWGTHNLYNGFRRVYFTPHIDDVFLDTELVNPRKGITWGGDVFRTSQIDFEKIVQFQKDILKDMPEGSFYRAELAFNGNGILIIGDYAQALDVDTSRTHEDDLEWVMPRGEGEKRWPQENYQFTPAQIAAFENDPVFRYISHNDTIQKEFFWSSHTFTHENLDSIDASDIDNEIRLNIEMAKHLGLLDTDYWSSSSIVTPQISGLHNVEALEIFTKYGIQSATGDLSRPAICNTENPYLPFFTTKESSNYEGFPVIPRTPTEVYYHCSTREENMWMFNQIYSDYYGMEIDFGSFLEHESKRTLLLMTQLRHEAHQFHQANLRYYEKGEFLGESLLEDWTRSVVNLYNQYVEWPLISIKISKQADVFIERAKLEACGSQTKLIVENDHIVGVSVSATKGDCTVPITVPMGVNESTLPADATIEQVGKDPLTVWVPVKKGETKSFKFDKALDWIVSGFEVDVTTTSIVDEPTPVVVEEEPTTTTTTTVVEEEPTTTTTTTTTTTVVEEEPTTTTTTTTTTTVVEEPTPVKPAYQCMSEITGYPCCPSIIKNVYYVDEYGEWSYDYKNNTWCGLTPYKEVVEEEECWSEKFGYNCCKNTCEVIDVDNDGKWGYENMNWCGIPSSCN